MAEELAIAKAEVGETLWPAMGTMSGSVLLEGWRHGSGETGWARVQSVMYIMVRDHELYLKRQNHILIRAHFRV